MSAAVQSLAILSGAGLGGLALLLRSARLGALTRASRERLELAAAAAKSVIYEWDLRSGRVARVGCEEAIFGRPAAEIAPSIEWWKAGIHEEDRDGVMSHIAARLGAGEGFDLEYRFRDAQGAPRHLSDRAVIVRDGRGKPRRVVGTIEDISLRLRDQETLSESREQFRALLESVRVVPWEMDYMSLRFTYVGPQVQKILGFTVDEWCREGFWTEHLAAEDRDAALAECLRAAASPRDHEMEYRMTAKDGRTVWIRQMQGSLRDDSGPVRLRGFLLDVTDRKRLEIELRQAQKLESVGQLAAGIAHEINTPIQFVGDSIHFLRDAFAELQGLLRAYRGLKEAAAGGALASAVMSGIESAEAAADVAYLEEQIPKAIDRTLEGTGRVAGIVRAMKEFAHPDRKEKLAADLNRALQSTLTVARNELKYVAEVETEFGDLPPVMCHLGDLNQVFLNLLVNAAHAIGEVVGKSGKKGTITVRTKREGEMVVVSIADTGCGIPEGNRTKVYEPFFTTKEVGRGTGQGLAIARSIVVEKHGGSLEFESEVGRGTTFHIRLPIEQRAKGSLAA